MKKILILVAIALVSAGCNLGGPQPSNNMVTEKPTPQQEDDIAAVINSLQNSVKDEEALQKQVVTDIIRTDKQEIIKLVNGATDDTDY